MQHTDTAGNYLISTVAQQNRDVVPTGVTAQCQWRRCQRPQRSVSPPGASRRVCWQTRHAAAVWSRTAIEATPSPRTGPTQPEGCQHRAGPPLLEAVEHSEAQHEDQPNREVRQEP